MQQVGPDGLSRSLATSTILRVFSFSAYTTGNTDQAVQWIFPNVSKLIEMVMLSFLDFPFTLTYGYPLDSELFEKRSVQSEWKKDASVTGDFCTNSKTNLHRHVVQISLESKLEETRCDKMEELQVEKLKTFVKRFSSLAADYSITWYLMNFARLTAQQIFVSVPNGESVHWRRQSVCFSLMGFIQYN
ncbi:hypothetical protein llap_4689 [Limosa lapponica baueri]|uniref:Uncharacterized protein n=1 Tax=Limosa lapponica baueri TaxID=1758121 RepID=A0A2I0UG23_LIMLA|nr:hypothetical protein llap_4689 [Limosa lapponica baueri]